MNTDKYDDKYDDNYEEKHVHAIYSKIAEHFSQTRYKVWPSVKQFMDEIPDNASVLEVGCGNGKNLEYLERVQNKTGCDFSAEFVEMVSKKGIPCVKCNAIDLPFEENTFDYVFSVAVIHHLSSDARRQVAVEEMMRTVKFGGTILIEVWGLEQENVTRQRKAVFLNEHDTLVPYKVGDNVFERYYHLFGEGELTTLVENAAKNTSYRINILETKYDTGNWVIVFQKTGLVCLAAGEEYANQTIDQPLWFNDKNVIEEEKESPIVWENTDVMYPQYPQLQCCGEYGEYEEYEENGENGEHVASCFDSFAARGEEIDESYINQLIRGSVSPTKKIKF